MFHIFQTELCPAEFDLAVRNDLVGNRPSDLFPHCSQLANSRTDCVSVLDLTQTMVSILIFSFSSSSLVRYQLDWTSKVAIFEFFVIISVFYLHKCTKITHELELLNEEECSAARQRASSRPLDTLVLCRERKELRRHSRRHRDWQAMSQMDRRAFWVSLLGCFFINHNHVSSKNAKISEHFCA